MFNMRSLALVFVIADLISAQITQTCSNNFNTLCLQNSDCVTIVGTGSTCTGGSGTANPVTAIGCCTGFTTTTTTTAATTSTNSTSCFDLINPVTGTSDCGSRSSLCSNSVYYTVMLQQCPRTCGLCSLVNQSTACADQLNPLTGASDCSARSSLCNDSTYYNVMTQQCPVTCGRCSSFTSIYASYTNSSTSTSTNSTCADQTNASTGVSDCSNRLAYCNNTVYAALMRVQCPASCGFCSG